MRKIVIVMTYYEREYQLIRTLFSIQNTKYENFEVIVVDDNSPNSIVLPELNYPVTVIKMTGKKWTNPEPAYNFGLQTAIKKNADIIIVQNAECYHVGDVINYASKVTNDNYISFGCLSIDEETTFKPHNIDGLSHIMIGASKDGMNAWYNHPTYRPVGYDFCAAITTENMIKLNGYDERFSNGMAYGDDFFLARVKRFLKVKITENPFVVHQWHYNGFGVPENKSDLVKRNKNLFNALEKEIRAEHIYTKDLCVSQ